MGNLVMSSNVTRRGKKEPFTQRGNTSFRTTNPKTSTTNLPTATGIPLGKPKPQSARERTVLLMKIVLVLLFSWIVASFVNKKFLANKAENANLLVGYPSINATIDSFSKIRKIGNKDERELKELESILPKDGLLLTPLLVPRYPSSPGLRFVRQYIKSYFASLNWHMQIDSFIDEKTPIGPIDFENLIFTHNPNAPNKIVLAAHYESKYVLDEGRTGLLPDGFVGATDSAWSCALLMYLASVITESVPKNAQYSFQIVFFDGEEAIRYPFFYNSTPLLGIGAVQTHCMGAGTWQLRGIRIPSLLLDCQMHLPFPLVTFDCLPCLTC